MLESEEANIDLGIFVQIRVQAKSEKWGWCIMYHHDNYSDVRNNIWKVRLYDYFINIKDESAI